MPLNPNAAGFSFNPNASGWSPTAAPPAPAAAAAGDGEEEIVLPPSAPPSEGAGASGGAAAAEEGGSQPGESGERQSLRRSCRSCSKSAWHTCAQCARGAEQVTSVRHTTVSASQGASRRNVAAWTQRRHGSGWQRLTGTSRAPSETSTSHSHNGSALCVLCAKTVGEVHHVRATSPNGRRISLERAQTARVMTARMVSGAMHIC